MSDASKVPTFSNRAVFILVTIGAAVGLGNVWSFPFVAGENGGSGFMVIYLVVLLLVATPIFMAELLLGRMGAGSPPLALKRLKGTKIGSFLWVPIGFMGLIAGILVLSFYGVVAGQAMAYGVYSLSGTFDGASTEDIKAIGESFAADPKIMFMWHIIFMGLVGAILSIGVHKGLEQMGKFLMPILFLLLFSMAIYAMSTGDAATTLDFLFGFHPEKITSSVVWEAVGQAFFTLGIGIGGILMLGVYMGEDLDLPHTVGWIVGADLLAAILAGLAIFPLVFASNELSPAAGPGLIFEILPNIFADIPGGWLVGALFFLLLTFAALTSAISIMAPSVVWLQEKGISRTVSAFVISGICIVLGLLTVFSANIWSDVHPLSFVPVFESDTFFGVIRKGINIYVLPIGGLAFALMVGWGIKRETVIGALHGGSDGFHLVWLWSLRFIAPVAIVAFFISQFV